MSSKFRKADSKEAGVKAGNRRTGSNAPKSCKQCRRSKQRCDIPDRTAIQASEDPQPLQLACHRCRVLQLPCIIEYPVDDAILPLFNRPKPTAAEANHQSRQQRRQRESSGDESVRQKPRKSASPPSTASSHRRDVTTPSNLARTPQSKRSSMEGHKEFHLFDPDFSGQVTQIQSHQFDGKDIEVAQDPTWVETDTITSIKHLRPFPYLTRLCSLQPGFLPQRAFRDDELPSIAAPSDINLEKYACTIDWQEMNMHLRCFRLCLPFLESFHPQGHSLEKVGIWLATCLYLASSRSSHIELHLDLFIYLRQQLGTCIKRGPCSMGEVASLVVMSVYEPFIITESMEDVHIDGSHMLASATLSLQSLKAGELPSQMKAFDFRDVSQTPMSLLRQCSLVVSVALYSQYQIFMGSADRHSSLLQFDSVDVDQMEIFCRLVVEWHRSQDEAEYASILLLLLYRYRSLRTLAMVNTEECNRLSSTSIAISNQGEHVLNKIVARLNEVATDILSELSALREDLAIDDDRCNMYLDFIEMDIKQLHTTCQANIQDICLILVEDHLGKATNPSTLAQIVLQDPTSLDFMRVLGRARTASCRKVAILLGNFTDRWSEAEGTSAMPGSNQLLAPPPAYICAMILPDIKSVCDGAAAFLHLGAAPKDCLADAQLDLAANLVRSFSKSLLSFVTSIGRNQSPLLVQTKGYGDLFQLVAHIASRTSHAIHEWTSASKGLRRTTNFTFRFAGRNVMDKPLPTLMKEKKSNSISERSIQKINVPYLAQSNHSSRAEEKQQQQDQEGGLPMRKSTRDFSSSIHTSPFPSSTQGATIDPNDFVYFENLLQEVLSTPVHLPSTL